MRIGIITCWWAKDNYGGILQSYALQKYLRDQGHDAFVIRFLWGGDNRFITKIKKVAKRVLYALSLYRSKSYGESIRAQKEVEEWNKIRNFDAFRKNNISVTQRLYKDITDLRKQPPLADAYITGSDQVWGVKLTEENHRIFYLDFGQTTIRRIAYAASFGQKQLPCADPTLFINLVKGFKAISVRETEGVEICKGCGIKALQCVDSTLLLQAETYKALMSPRKNMAEYAYFYTVNVSSPDEIYWSEISNWLKENQIHTIVTTGSGYKRAKEMFEGATYDYSTVEEWLANIYYSRYVITSSFHGIVFSILFQKDFIYIPLKSALSKGNDRIYDLLRHVNLEERTAESFKDAQRILARSINYKTLVTRELLRLRDQSISFLEGALG